MTERELSIIRALGEEFRAVLADLQRTFEEKMAAQSQAFEEKLASLSAVQQKSVTADDMRPVLQTMVDEAVGTIPVPRDGRDYDPDVLQQAVREEVQKAVSEIPVPQDGKSVTADDVRPMLEQMVKNAMSRIPVPRDGRDYDPDVLQKAVNDAVAKIPVPADGKSITPDDVQPMLSQMVDEAVSRLPVPQDGRDAAALEILPGIDEQKHYPRGTYATHHGGLWRAYEKTCGMRGWECLVDGVAGVDIQQDGARCFTVTLTRSGGERNVKSFALPVMLYRGVFAEGAEYQPGDTVTWGGSLWHCNALTTDRPGETGTTGWTLAVKKGRDLRG